MSATLTAILDGLAERLADALPGIHVTADPPAGRSLRVPALVVELAEFEAIGNPGDTRTLVDARIELRAVVDPAGARAHMAVRELAARALHAALGLRRIAPGHGHLRPIRAGEDDFRPELDGYQIWVIEMAAEIALGDLEPAAPPAPSQVHLSYSPAIGAAHESDYLPVMPSP